MIKRMLLKIHSFQYPQIPLQQAMAIQKVHYPADETDVSRNTQLAS